MDKIYDTVIIGGGISGMATALRRHKKGDKVLLIEKSEQLGGKLGVHKWEDYFWDKGPSLFTLPNLITELFTLYNKNPQDYFEYSEMEENCRYFFESLPPFTFYKDKQKRREELEKVFSIEEIVQVEDYLANTEKIYNEIGELFIDEPKLGFKDMFKLKVVKQYPKLMSQQMLHSLNDYNQKQFQNPHLIQLFNRFGTYNGSNPYQMSGLYSMIPHLELNLGTFFPKGGMRAIIDSLEKLMQEEGIEYALKIEKIEVSDRENGVIVKIEDQIIEAKRLVSAIDHMTFYDHIYQDDRAKNKYKDQVKSTSAVVFYWAVNHKFDEIGLHNMLFSSDYRHEFEQIFDNRKIPKSPSIYIHNSSVVEPNQAPENGQNWFVMINTPAGIEPSNDQINELRKFVLSRVQELVGIDIKDHIIHEKTWTMKGIENDTGSLDGALYGAAFNTKTASFKRHGNQSKKNKNIYFTGGSVHPGGGIPLVLKSAKIVDQLIDKNGNS